MTPLAIIVVLYRSRAELGPLWDCLRAQTFADWRLVAVDNSPEDGGGAFLESLGDPRITVLRNTENAGFARAVNQGLRHALTNGAERTMLLNPDTEFTPDFLGALVAAWDATGAEVIAPRVMFHDDPQRSWYAGGYLDFGWIFSNRHDDYRPGGPGSRVVEYASGCCLGLAAALLRRIGLLDESFFVYWEDTDFCLRLKAAGVPIHYVEEPFLLHHAGASSGGERSPAAEALYFTSYAVLVRKHFPRRQGLAMLLRVFLKERGRAGRYAGRAGLVGKALLKGYLLPLRPVERA